MLSAAIFSSLIHHLCTAPLLFLSLVVRFLCALCPLEKLPELLELSLFVCIVFECASSLRVRSHLAEIQYSRKIV